MRHLIVGMLATLFAVSAQAQTPSPSDRHGWLSFCAGFYKEITEQAIEDDNRLLHAKAQEKAALYADEFSERVNDGSISGQSENTARWVAQGERAAGKGLWQAARAVDKRIQDNIIASRRSLVDRCDEVASGSYICCRGAQQKRVQAMKDLEEFMAANCPGGLCKPEARQHICRQWAGILSFLNCAQ